jgi:hypothetical protein
MPFQAGQSGNPRGRKKGFRGGRTQALASMDHMLAKSKNKQQLEREMEEEFQKGAMKFFRTYVMPLLPKESKVAVENDGIVMWRNLLGQDVRAEDVGGGKKSEQ